MPRKAMKPISGEVVVDGYNLLHAMKAHAGGSGLEALRRRLDERLAGFSHRSGRPVTVVYDGQGALQDMVPAHAVRTVFTERGKSADWWIIDYAKALNAKAKLVTIISSDNEIRRYGAAFGADCMPSEAFARLLERNPKKTPSRKAEERKYSDLPLDEQEINAWKRLFLRGKHTEP